MQRSHTRLEPHVRPLHHAWMLPDARHPACAGARSCDSEAGVLRFGPLQGTCDIWMARQQAMHAAPATRPLQGVGHKAVEVLRKPPPFLHGRTTRSHNAPSRCCLCTDDPVDPLLLRLLLFFRLPICTCTMCQQADLRTTLAAGDGLAAVAPAHAHQGEGRQSTQSSPLAPCGVLQAPPTCWSPARRLMLLSSGSVWQGAASVAP